ncbi:MAG: HD-GYP domain-containing protein [Gemmatimonadetes bacterium]|nr:HD-GYP domain-containing protein [Gemmatimonadota bacterium]
MPVLVGLQVVIAFYLAWLASHLGWLGAAGMVLPLLAVRQLSRTTIELTRVTEELLDLMVAAIEARDPYTSGHSKRVASAATKIAKAIGLKPEEVERVQVAALLHDVGKINEEFARILAKEGRLTAEEWDIMKRHPIRSAELVGLVSSLRDLVPAVRHHHENWDGTGYPDGRKGQDIPLASRIIMFADTLDAITTDRPYRRALDPEEARKEFIKFRGRQFDPAICDAVVSEGGFGGTLPCSAKVAAHATECGPYRHRGVGSRESELREARKDRGGWPLPIPPEFLGIRGPERLGVLYAASQGNVLCRRQRQMVPRAPRHHDRQRSLNPGVDLRAFRQLNARRKNSWRPTRSAGPSRGCDSQSERAEYITRLQ